MDQSSNNHGRVTIADKEFEAKLAQIKKVHQRKYDYLTNSSPVIRFFQVITFLMVIFLVPLQVAFNKSIPGDYILSERWDFLFPLGFIIAIGYANLRYLITHYYEFKAFNEISEDIRNSDSEIELKIDITDTRHYRLIDVLQNTFIAGTIFTACLWYLYPEENRLEPLTIIYGFGTALFGYFRTRFNVTSLIDRFIETDSPHHVNTDGDKQ